ncbi:SPOR domain-containing protein [Schleiferia thermophila]|nr:SPOR domain-containing protein [Schleiferia thermophila]
MSIPEYIKVSAATSSKPEKEKKPSRRKYFFRKLFVILIIFTPLWSFLAWYFWPKKPMRIFILDKTVSRTSYDEHMSLMWVLNYNRFTKENLSRYRASQDYFGFFPTNRPQFKVKDLTLYSDEQLDSISQYYDMFYYTDAYGVYSNEWYLKGDINERSSLIYGGANFSEVTLMEKIFQQRKLLIGEFNLVASPTPYDVRKALEDLFQFRYTGWTLRYYPELDTAKNQDIPKWMVRLHDQTQENRWNYKGPGIAYVSEWGTVFILTKEKDLISEIPVINTKKKYAEYYKIPEFLRYPFWQDVVIPYSESNVIANYKVHTNERGDSFLQYYKIPKIYPAVIGDSAENLRFYFAGDFSDNPIGYISSYFKGIYWLRKLFYNNQDFNDRRKFFWEYYQPLLQKIFYDYYLRKERIDRTNPRPLPKRTSTVQRSIEIPDFSRENKILISSQIIDYQESSIPYGVRKMQALLSQKTSATSATGSAFNTYEIEYEDSRTTEKSASKTPVDSTTTYSTKETKKDQQVPSTEKESKTSASPSPLPQSEQTKQSPSAPTNVATPSSKSTDSPRTLPTLTSPKEHAAEQQEKPYISQKAFIDRLVVLTRNGAFIRGRDYFGQNGTIPSTSATTSGISTDKKSVSASWMVIIGSFTSEENARAFAAINPSYEIIKLPGTPYFRVVYKSYNSLREAKADVASIKSEFPDAWLLRI